MSQDSSDELISVIIPAYNQGPYLEEAVESVYLQDYRPLQVIVVNDGSTDNTDEVAKKLLANHSDLEYIKQNNAGVCLASRKGLEAAKGEFLIRLDADDYLPPGYISTLHACLKKSFPPVVYAYCDAEYVGERQGRMPSAPFSLSRLVQENYIHVSALVKTEAAREVGYFNPNMVHGFEDWDFWLSLAEKGMAGIYCQDTFLYYRQKAISRNLMDAERHRAMRETIYANHPLLFKRLDVQLKIGGWKLRRRLRRYAGLEGK